MKRMVMMILAAAIYAGGICMGCRAENRAIFLRGYDASFCSEFGKDVHRGSDGKPCDIFYLLKEHGINCVRLRVWNNPSSPDNPDTPGQKAVESVQNQENVIHAVIDVTQANGGLGVFFWEDGKPGSWRGLFDSTGKAMPGLDALGGQKD